MALGTTMTYASHNHSSTNGQSDFFSTKQSSFSHGLFNLGASFGCRFIQNEVAIRQEQQV